MSPSAGAAALSCTLSPRDNDAVLFDLDYRRYVDGKLRNDGVTASLKSRGIESPQGAQEDGTGVKSVCAPGNLNDMYLLKHLKQSGVEPCEAAITLVRALCARTTRAVPLDDELAERAIPGNESR